MIVARDQARVCFFAAVEEVDQDRALAPADQRADLVGALTRPRRQLFLALELFELSPKFPERAPPVGILRELLRVALHSRSTPLLKPRRLPADSNRA